MKLLHRLLIGTCLVLSFFLFLFYGKDRDNFHGDAFGYYLYLPSLFIYDNLLEPATLSGSDTLPKGRQMIRKTLLSNNIVTPKGYVINQYTYGIALFESPFFFLAHGIELLRHGRADGMTQTYQELLFVANLFYALLGLYILYLCLKRFFGTTDVYLGLTVLVCGTNFMWFAVVQWGMSHIITFMLVASLIYLTISVYEQARTRTFILIGVVSGLIILIRPTDFVFLAIPFLWGTYNWNTITERLRFLGRHWPKLFGAAAAAFLFILPQLLYWKATSGKLLFYSYGGNQAFHWRHPEIVAGLFSCKNGWLSYSPVMVLSLLGLLCRRKLRPLLFVFVCVLPVFIYLTYAWYCYNYINGFGSRPMINMYPLLAFPLTAMMAHMRAYKRVVRYIFACFITFLCAVSFSFQIQQGIGILWSECSNATFNRQTMFRYYLTYEDLVCFDNEIVQPKKTELDFVASLAAEDFEQRSAENVVYDSIRGSKIYELKAGEEYLKFPIEVPGSAVAQNTAQWIKCSGIFYGKERTGMYSSPMLVLEIKSDTNFIAWYSCKLMNKIGVPGEKTPPGGYHVCNEHIEEWGEVSYYVPVPKELPDGAVIRMQVWSVGFRPIRIDNLKLELFRTRE